MTSQRQIERRLSRLVEESGLGDNTEIVITDTLVDEDGQEVETFATTRAWTDERGEWQTEEM
ncbi:hypothetical protein [Haladaptatus sp. NG-SE-30]